MRTLTEHHRPWPIRTGARLCLPLVSALIAGCAAPSRSSEATSRTITPLVERTTLPAELRDRLHGRMDRHGDALDDLIWSVVLLDRPATALITAEIGLWQTTWGDLGSEVPPRFAELERELRTQTDQLGQLARGQNTTDEQIGQAFARLSTTCVSCHALYLYGQ